MLAIEATGLTKTFRKRRSLSTVLFKPWTPSLRVEALRGIDLSVPFGTVFGLLGPNGAGKSTLIKILTSLISQTDGAVRVNGFDTRSQGSRVRASVGIVPSGERSLYWRLTGRENLRFFSRLYDLSSRQASSRIPMLLDLLELGSKADQPVLSYSSGMRQKLAICRALLHDPPILFLDEPTRSLDPSAAKRLRQFVIDRLHRETGKTVFLATHNLAEAETLCDRLAVLQNGKIVAEGSAGEICAQHQAGETYILTVRSPRMIDEPGLESECLEPGLYRLTLELSGREGALGDHLERFIGMGVKIISCRRSEHPLQGVFDRLREGENS